jgi:hypothetical protein
MDYHCAYASQLGTKEVKKKIASRAVMEENGLDLTIQQSFTHQDGVATHVCLTCAGKKKTSNLHLKIQRSSSHT